jgi:hypothetical protein
MTELRLITKEIREQLRKPFPKEAHSSIASKSYLTSIKAHYVIERLNDVFGIGRWNFEHKVILERNSEVLVLGKLKILDYDCEIPEQYGSHKIEGKGLEIADGYKSAVTDSLTKCASYIEVGIDVFKGLVNPDGTYKNGNKSSYNPKPSLQEKPKEKTQELINISEGLPAWLVEGFRKCKTIDEINEKDKTLSKDNKYEKLLNSEAYKDFYNSECERVRK